MGEDKQVKSGSFSIVPDYGKLFKMFFSEFEDGAYKAIDSGSLEVVSTLRTLLVPLNIALNSIDSTERLTEFQERFGDIVSRAARTYDEMMKHQEDLEYDEDEDDTE